MFQNGARAIGKQDRNTTVKVIGSLERKTDSKNSKIRSEN
jgi:hypothetical protein